MVRIDEEALEAALSHSLLQGDLGALWNAKLKIPGGLTEREKARIERERLSSANVDIVEEHDQFYRDHKLLLVLFRYLAVMPVIRETGKVVFRWKSGAMLYAIVFYALASIVVLVVGYERMKILQTTKKFDDYIYGIIFVIFLVPHFWIPFVGWGVATQVAVYKTMWGTFQLRYYRVTGKDLEFPRLKTMILIISIACLVCAVMFLLALSVLLDGFSLWHTSAYYHIITMINMNCALWFINSRAIEMTSNSLSDCFREDVGIECTAAVVSRYRFLWLNLSELLQTLGSAYARTYSTYCLFMFCNITIAIYGALSEILDHGLVFNFKEIGLFVDTVYCSILLYVFCNCSHNATLRVAQGVQDTLLTINLMKVDQPTEREIDLFIQAIEMNPAIVSLKGYANVNRELLTSTCTTMAIYLIVLLQFKVSLMRNMPTSTENILNTTISQY